MLTAKGVASSITTPATYLKKEVTTSQLKTGLDQSCILNTSQKTDYLQQNSGAMKHLFSQPIMHGLHRNFVQIILNAIKEYFVSLCNY
jgi:hypothetical protein